MLQTVITMKIGSDVINLHNGYSAIISPNKISFAKNPVTKKKPINIENASSKNDDFVSLTILPSYNCNLRCIYCYSRAGDVKNNMNEELVKGILEYYSKKFSDIRIRFAGGGEPFKNFELMKFSVEYAKKLFKSVSIHTITNGTFNGIQFKWLKDNKSFVRISFDSIVQDIQRPFANKKSSSSIVIRNIKQVLRNGLPLAVQTIITSKSVGLMKEMVGFSYDLGVRDIKLEPVYISDASRGEEDLMVTPKVFVDNFIDLIKFIRKNEWKILIDSSFISRPSTGFYCTMPKGNNVLTPEGYVTSCVEISKKSEPFSDLLFYAKWDKNKKVMTYNKNKIKKLNRLHFSKFSNCAKCNLRLICKGGCPMRRFWRNKNGVSQQIYACSITKMLIPQVLKLIQSDKEYARILMCGYKINNEKKS